MTDRLQHLAAEAREINRTLDYWNPDELYDEYYNELAWRETEILEEMARLIFETESTRQEFNCRRCTLVAGVLLCIGKLTWRRFGAKVLRSCKITSASSTTKRSESGIFITTNESTSKSTKLFQWRGKPVVPSSCATNTELKRLMRDQEKRRELDRNNPNKTWEETIADKMRRKGLTREEAIADIYQTATKSNPEVNRKFNLE